MTTTTLRPAAQLKEAGLHNWLAAWYLAGVTVAFLLPFLFTSVLDLNGDLYYGIYFAGVLAFLGAFSKAASLDLRELFTRRWRWSIVLGLVMGAVVVWGVFARDDSTPRPEGLYFAFTIAWRGLAYGVVDALLLSAFPVAVAYAALGRRLDGLFRKAEFAALATILVMAITATYHLGYEQFRDNGVAAPEFGNALISVPAIATINPLGSIVAHASMHIAADVRVYETDTYLPPQRSAK